MNAALMIPELGHVALILALCLALVQATLPLIGAWLGDRQWMGLAGGLGPVRHAGIRLRLPDLGLHGRRLLRGLRG
jgi:cytochrome c biogenesis factor